MQSSAAARRYARALFGLAKEAGRTREVLDEVLRLNELVDANPPLRDALLTPLYPASERRAPATNPTGAPKAQIRRAIRTRP